MEEKERFELFGEHCIKDNDKNARCQLLDTYKACVILNEQDKRIKELELLLNADKKIKTNSIKGFEKLKAEIKQLKQSQKQLATSELEKIRQLIVSNDEYDEEIGCNIIKTFDLLEDIMNRIKELKGEE